MQQIGVVKITGKRQQKRRCIMTFGYTSENLEQAIQYALACRIDNFKRGGDVTARYEVSIW